MIPEKALTTEVSITVLVVAGHRPTSATFFLEVAAPILIQPVHFFDLKEVYQLLWRATTLDHHDNLDIPL